MRKGEDHAGGHHLRCQYRNRCRTKTPAADRKQCVNYGQRVQNSVFECLLDAAQCRMLQAKLVSIMDEELDSLRFYYLGNQYEQKIQHFGRNAGYQPEGVLMV